MIKAYLFGSIFYEKDIEYNKELLLGIRRAWPGIDIFAPQEAPFNDKRTCADTTAIFEGDCERLKETDLLIGCLDGDLPPIGSVTELGIFAEMARHNPEKHVVVLHTDTRDGYKTASMEKYADLEDNQCHSQMNYFNLFTAGAIESCGAIVGTKEQLFEYVHELYTEYIKNNHFSGIYMITNRINNKKYIGQSVDVPARLNNHRWVTSDNPQAIDLAIQKYGIENFTFEALEKCSEQELDEKEQYWCNEVYGCSTYSPSGYNIAVAGGQYGQPTKSVTSYSLEGKKIKTYPSILAAARELKCNQHAIRQALNNNARTSNGMLWKGGNDESCAPAELNPHRGPFKAVDVYNEKGRLLASYETITEAALAHNVNYYRAAASYNNPGIRSGGLYFVPAGEQPQLQFSKMQKKLYYYNKQTRQYIGTFDSAREAGRKLNIDNSSILKAVKGQKYYCGNYIWSYILYDKIPADYKEINERIWEEMKNNTFNEEDYDYAGEVRNDL